MGRKKKVQKGGSGGRFLFGFLLGALVCALGLAAWVVADDQMARAAVGGAPAAEAPAAETPAAVQQPAPVTDDPAPGAEGATGTADVEPAPRPLTEEAPTLQPAPAPSADVEVAPQSQSAPSSGSEVAPTPQVQPAPAAPAAESGDQSLELAPAPATAPRAIAAAPAAEQAPRQVDPGSAPAADTAAPSGAGQVTVATSTAVVDPALDGEEPAVTAAPSAGTAPVPAPETGVALADVAVKPDAPEALATVMVAAAPSTSADSAPETAASPQRPSPSPEPAGSSAQPLAGQTEQPQKPAPDQDVVAALAPSSTNPADPDVEIATPEPPEPAPDVTVEEERSKPRVLNVQGGNPANDQSRVAALATSTEEIEDAAASGGAEASDAPAWIVNAAAPPAEAPSDAPLFAIVIDDVGVYGVTADRLANMSAAITYSVAAGREGSSEIAEALRSAGFEIIAHLPMEPLGGADPGPNPILTGMTDDEIRETAKWHLDRIEGYVGVSNHMGSRATQDRRVMGLILDEVEARGLLFLDSRTTGRSVAARLARGRGLPLAENTRFIDNSRETGAILRNLNLAALQAQRSGPTVVVGHPWPETIDAIATWLNSASAQRVSVVPLSAIAAAGLKQGG